MRTLRRFLSPFERVLNACPRLGLDCRHESICTGRRSAVSNSLKRVYFVDHQPANLSGCRFDDRAGLCLRCPPAGRSNNQNTSTSTEKLSTADLFILLVPCSFSL